MPYIICVNQPGCLPEQDPTAVATIEEARETAREALVSMERTTFAEAARATELGEDIRTLPEAGGVIGPLPDGYVIEVRAVSWEELAQLALDADKVPPLIFDTEQDRAEVIDAYNQN